MAIVGIVAINLAVGRALTGYDDGLLCGIALSGPAMQVGYPFQGDLREVLSIFDRYH